MEWQNGGKWPQTLKGWNGGINSREPQKTEQGKITEDKQKSKFMSYKPERGEIGTSV